MKIKHLRMNLAARAVLIGLLLGVAGVTKGYAAWDFSAVCSTGQTLYYKKGPGSSVRLTYPGTSNRNPWGNYSKPTGALAIPSSVTNNGNTYSVTYIGEYAFYGCNLLSSVEIPNTVKYIEKCAFYECKGLTIIEIPSSVTSIGSLAFFDCTGCEQIVVESGNTVFDSRDNCNAIIKTNSNELVLGCKNTIIPNTVTAIGQYAFNDCSGLTSITIPNTVTSIGNYAFQNCSGAIGDLIIPNSVSYIGQFAFYGCSAVTGDLVIPNSVTYIGRDAFNGCEGLTSVVIPSSVTSIEYGVFINCKGLISVTIPNSVTTIGNMAFCGCSSLASIEIPNSVLSIGNGAISSCTSLTSLVIPNSVTTIDAQAFSGNSALEEIIVSPDNPKYDSRNNCNAIIETSTNELMRGCMNTIIPNSVTSIGIAAFIDTHGLPSINIPNSVTSIGEAAFYGTDLTSIRIPNSVSTIEKDMFRECTNLTTVIIPNTITSIGEYAFCSCNSLTSLTIPNTVTSIGEYAFSECIGLTEVMMLGTNPPSIKWSFNYVYYSYPIYVPYESLNAYKTATSWSNYESRIYPWLQKSISAHGTNENISGWNFISSPLVADTTPTAIDSMIAATANNYDLYRFNQSAELEWENWKNDDEVLNHYQFDIENGQGYLYANAEDVNLIFKGTFNEDDTKTVSLTYDQDKPLAGWNLVGNPFPVNAYATKSYYRMNDDGSAIYPTAVSTSTAIAPCTGIMVKAETTGESVTFSKTATSGQPANNGLLQIAVANANTRGTSTGSATAAIDKAIVSFNEGNTLEKFVFNKDNAQLYIPQNGKDYAIAFSESQGEMPLNFKATKDGTYTLSIDAENVEMGYLHLIDNMTGVDVDLLAAKVPEPAEGPATYTFNAKTTDYESRFKLVFSANNKDGVSTSSTAFAFFSDGNLIVSNEGEATLQVVDVTGRILSNETINGSISKAIKAVPGVYMIRLINGNDVKTQKIVVK